MLKATLSAAYLLIAHLPIAFADVYQIDEDAIVKAIGSPVLKTVQEEDSPGCMTTRYTFGDKVFDMKLEFKCNRINVAWAVSNESQNAALSKQAAELAQRAVIALTHGNGIEVERVLAGGTYQDRTYTNGLSVRGSCVMSTCLLTFK
jgi:hypothetical protein